MKWTDNLSVEIPSIDEQHRKIIDIINDLHEGYDNSSDRDWIVQHIMGSDKKYSVFLRDRGVT
jgi:hemerythrin